MAARAGRRDRGRRLAAEAERLATRLVQLTVWAERRESQLVAALEAQLAKTAAAQRHATAAAEGAEALGVHVYPDTPAARAHVAAHAAEHFFYLLRKDDAAPSLQGYGLRAAADGAASSLRSR